MRFRAAVEISHHVAHKACSVHRFQDWLKHGIEIIPSKSPRQLLIQLWERQPALFYLIPLVLDFFCCFIQRNKLYVRVSPERSLVHVVVELLQHLLQRRLVYGVAHHLLKKPERVDSRALSHAVVAMVTQIVPLGHAFAGQCTAAAETRVATVSTAADVARAAACFAFPALALLAATLAAIEWVADETELVALNLLIRLANALVGHAILFLSVIEQNIVGFAVPVHLHDFARAEFALANGPDPHHHALLEVPAGEGEPARVAAVEQRLVAQEPCDDGS
jgi:hypothetical protein